MCVIGPHARKSRYGAGMDICAAPGCREPRRDSVCCVEIADRVRAATRDYIRAELAAGAFLRGEASRHCINLLEGRREIQNGQRPPWLKRNQSSETSDIFVKHVKGRLTLGISASTVGYAPQLYCVYTTQHSKSLKQ